MMIEPASLAEWKQAFRWLAALELGPDVSVVIPEHEHYLRERTKTLAILFDLLPRVESQRFPELVAAWSAEWGDQPAVALADLRKVARRVFLESHEQTTTDDLWNRAIRLSGWQVTHPVPPTSVSTRDTGVSVTDQRFCAEGLLHWFRELQADPQWNTLPGIVPGEADRPLSDVFVELFAVEDNEVVQHDGAEFGPAVPRSRHAVPAVGISVASMIVRTLERCVVVGDPGSGKSTLVKWLVWATFRGKLPDFDVALEIKLSAYASMLAEEPTLTPLEFFFRSRGQSASDARSAATALRRAARDSQRYLFLLDGWDEVPVAQRLAVREQLLSEDRSLISLITSRPSGMPRQLLDRQQVACYRIAGLTPALAEELTGKVLRQLGCPERKLGIWSQIREDAQLQDMATNPFLLGLVVRTLLEARQERLGTRTAIYRQVTGCIREQYAHICEPGKELSAEHLCQLAAFSFTLLNDRHVPRYLFSRRDLETGLIGLSADPVLRSRFVTKPVSVLDEFTLLHATIQEFLAAEHVTTCDLAAQKAFVEEAFLSTSKLVVLEFMAGMTGEAGAACQNAAKVWSQSPDRFLQITMRIARLAIAGNWPIDELGQCLRHSLWAEISKDRDEDLKLCQLAVEIYAQLDASDLIRRARQKPLSTWAINCLMESIPAPIARAERLDELLKGKWRDVAGFDWLGGADAVEREELHQRLNCWEVPTADFLETVVQAGGCQDETTVPVLVRIAKSDILPNSIQEEAISSLARIGGTDALHAILDFLLDLRTADHIVQMAAGAMIQQANPRLKLNPQGRDRLLRRLAALPGNHPRVKFLLMALEGLPIRDGAEVLADLATDTDLSTAVCQQAIYVLQFVTDRNLLNSLVKMIAGRPHDQTQAWLKLASERALPIQLSWLKMRIFRCRNPHERESLLNVLFQMLVELNVTERTEESAFLDILAAKGLETESDEDGLIQSMLAALDKVSPKRIVLFSEKTRKAALAVVARWCAAPEPDRKHQVLWAVAIVRHFRDRTAIGFLSKLLMAIHSRGISADEAADYKIAFEVANCLAELAPVELLRLPADCPGVLWALRTRSLQEGWLVFTDRILNADGLELASLSQPDALGAIPGETVELRTLLEALSPQTRRVLECYWLMVRPGGACHVRDSHLSIHQLAQSIYDEASEDSEVANLLRNRFPAAFPKFSAWTKQLNRVEHRFEGDEQAETLLRSLGLYRR